MKEIIKGKCLVWSAALLIAASLSITTAVNAESEVKEWKVPFLAFLSGPYAGFGKQIKWAADDAAGEINAAGGVAGKPIVIEYHDTALDPSKAAAEMSKVVNDSLIIFGPIAATETKAAMPLVVREKAFAMAIACGTDVNLEFQPYTVHFIGHYDETIGPPMRGWIKRNTGMKTVVQFVWPLDPTWVDIANAQRRAMEGEGLKVLPDVEVSEGVDMASVVVRAMSENPDGFVITVGPVEAGKIIKELDKRGVKDKSRIMIFATAHDPALFEIAGEYVKGAYHWNEINMWSDSPRWKALFARYREAFPEFPSPTIGVPLFYDMVYMAKAAIENTGVTGDPAKLAEERDKVRNYCRNLKDFPGVLGNFDIIDGIANPPSLLLQMTEKEAILVELYPPK